MEKPRIYSKTMLTQMNYGGGCWQNCITQDNSNTSKTDSYVLHATGNADLDGRKYIALPLGTKIDDSIKQKYNLM